MGTVYLDSYNTRNPLFPIMSSTIRKSIDRRHFLRGVGGAALSLPYLHVMAESKSITKAPKRMVCIGSNYGFVPSQIFPKQSGNNYQLSPLLKPLAHMQNDFTVISGLDHGDTGTGGHKGVHSFLSGVVSSSASSFAEKNISLDQKAAEFVGETTRYPSMQLTTGSVPINLLSWNSSGVAIPPIVDLRAIYAALFQNPKGNELNVLKRAFNEEKSILDLVALDAKALQKELGKDDKEKVDQYFTSLRSIEKRLTQSKAWLNRPKPKVSYALPEGIKEMDFIDRVPLYYDLMALALQTDSTRVISFEISDFGYNNGGFEGVQKGYHQLSHHGKMPDFLKELSIVETFHMQQFARFQDQLKTITEADGSSLFDNTMSLIGSGMGNASSHSNRSLPFVLAGGGFKHGSHMQFNPSRQASSPPATNIFTSMLQNFGLEIERFNTATGTLTGLDISA